MQCTLITPQTLFNPLCNTETSTSPKHIIQQVKFPFSLFSSSIIYSLSFSLFAFSQISMASYTWGRGSLTDTSVGVAVSVPAPPLEQGCLPEESAHGNTNSPNSSSGTNGGSSAGSSGVLAALPEFIDAIDSVRKFTINMYKIIFFFWYYGCDVLVCKNVSLPGQA